MWRLGHAPMELPAPSSKLHERVTSRSDMPDKGRMRASPRRLCPEVSRGPPKGIRMTTMKKLAAGAATTVLAMAVMGGLAFAQETTGGINGTARGPGGKPLANAPVTVVYSPTNQTFTTTTDGNGLFSIRQLPPGGPYSVRVGDQTQVVDSVGLGASTEVTVAPEVGGGNALSEVTVTATRAGPQVVQTGPRSTFNSTDIATLPTFSRDLKDIARLNPFVTLDPSNSNGLIIAGNNYRSNTIYVDGVRQSDDFGLNANGYPTQRSPLSIDLVQSLNVEVAPYDVSYGQFTGGVLNISTKSGSNEIHGSAYYEYDSDHLGAGKEIRDRFVSQRFQDKTYGFTLSGPIVKDKVFFQFGYERYEGLSSASYGASDQTGVANQVAGVTSAQVAQVQNILKTVYGYDAGVTGLTQPITDTKYFGKLTWQVTDKQRFVFEAQSTDGQSFNQPDDSATRLGLSSTTYVLDQALTSYTGYLYSNWTQNFSTEVSFTHREVDTLTNNIGAPFPNFNIYLGGNTTTLPTINVGQDISRQANSLITSSDLFRIRGTYTLGGHTILAGYERDARDVTDLFVQNALGAYTFSSIANLQSGAASQLVYANAASNNVNDGVVPLSYVIHIGYIQDEWRPLSNLTLRFGLRDEYYEQGDVPRANPFLQQSFGVRTDVGIDGKNVLLPRFGFNWRPVSGLVINGGVGRFSGGSPDVYLNNAFNGTGNILGSVTCLPTTTTCPTALVGVNGKIPANVLALNTASANAGTGVTAPISKNFEPPTLYKVSLGAAYTANFADWSWTGVAGHYIGNNWRIHADYIYQQTDKALILQDLDTQNNIIALAPDGRPLYNPNRANPARYDLVLTNSNRGFSNVYAVGGGKTFDNGIDFDVTYTHTRALDVNPFTSSVALSNYRQLAFADANNPSLAISNYSIPDQIKFNVGFEHRFFGDYASRLRVYAQRRTGLAYSYTYVTGTGASGAEAVFGLANSVSSSQELVYVPKTDSTGNVTLTSDPKVSYAFSGAVVAGTGPQTIDGFNAFLKATGLIKYAGQIAPRNAFNSRDVTTADLQFTQEIPAFFPSKARGELYFSVFNIGNLINNSWGVLDQYGFPYTYAAITPTIVSCTGNATCAPGQVNQYRYTAYSGRTPTIQTTGSPPPSTWALKLGVRYKF